MAKVLRMVFRNADGKAVTITLNDPKDNLTQAQVSSAMDTIIAKNVFTSSGGDLVEKTYAEVVETTRNTIYGTP
ncbi:MAG: DUF2922 domain-containing protein [Desulfurispora sp.]|uniref:DUF2922 domain-containing protein n=1 Tax=Desulfurispora sp. TaxID=3014275 RepID=UPI00404AF43B